MARTYREERKSTQKGRDPADLEKWRWMRSTAAGSSKPKAKGCVLLPIPSRYRLGKTIFSPCCGSSYCYECSIVVDKKLLRGVQKAKAVRERKADIKEDVEAAEAVEDCKYVKRIVLNRISSCLFGDCNESCCCN
jgi:hypothetical protein